MTQILNKFVENITKSFEIGIIRYSLFNLSILLVPSILMVLPWIGFILPFITGDFTMFFNSSMKLMVSSITGDSKLVMSIVFSVVMFIIVLLLSAYTENCLLKGYSHTLDTNEKLGYREYLRNGRSGYISYVGKSIIHLLLPMVLVIALVMMTYMIPVVGYALGDVLVLVSTTYLAYRFYAKLLGLSYNNFKSQLPNFVGLLALSFLLSLFGLTSLEFIVNSFITPICIIRLVSNNRFSKESI